MIILPRQARDKHRKYSKKVPLQAQFLDMIVDGQGDDGAVSDITPTVWQLGAMQPSDASWGSAFPTMAYQVGEGDDEFFMFCPESVSANNRLSRACLGKQSMFSASRKQHRKKGDLVTPQWLTSTLPTPIIKVWMVVSTIKLPL